MKYILTICLMVAAPVVWAGDNTAANPHESAIVKGEVLEVKDVESYTYLRLKASGGETWAAVIKAPVKKGDTVTIENIERHEQLREQVAEEDFPDDSVWHLGWFGRQCACGQCTGRTCLGYGLFNAANQETR